MDIENKDGFILITFSKDADFEFLTKELQNQLSDKHVIVDLLQTSANLETLNNLIPIAENYRENNLSLILVIANIDIDEAPDEVSFAPTFLEATDLLEMENLERELIQGDE